MNINDLLKIAVERKASDLHLKVGSHPVLRIDGELLPLPELKRLMQEDTIAMAFSIMNARQKQRFKDEFEIDIAYSVPGLGRFRCNVFQQRGTVGLVLRVIPGRILTIRELTLPPVLEKICAEQRGLVLVHRHDRLGQVDDAGRDDRLHQLAAHRAHHDDRGPDRVPAPRQEVDRQPARGRGRHPRLRRRPALGAAPGSRRDPGRRDARLRDDRDRAARGRDRPPGASRRCTPWTRPRPSTASSRSSRRTSRSRSASSSRRCSRRSSPCA